METYLPIPSSTTPPSPFFTPDGAMKWKTVAFFFTLLLALTVTVTILTELVKPQTAPEKTTPIVTAVPLSSYPSPTTAVKQNLNWQTYTFKLGSDNLTIQYPPGCVVSDKESSITCYGTNDGYFTLYLPSITPVRVKEMGEPIIDELTFGVKKWERALAENNLWASYSNKEKDNGKFYVLAVEYQPFSEKAQNLAEAIVGTFEVASAGAGQITPTN